jgi:hypothetical protein
MADETVKETEKPSVAVMTDNEVVRSSILHVSLRGWLALILVGTVCYMAIASITVEEPLYSLATLALGFYFGQKEKKS